VDQYYDSEEEFIIDDTLNPFDQIYQGSRLNRHEFNITFLWLCNTIRIGRSNRNFLLDFLERILPKSSKIPHTYRQLLNEINYKAPKIKLLCRECSRELNENDQHLCPKAPELHLKPVELLQFDLELQIKMLITNEWKTMKAYGGLQFL